MLSLFCFHVVNKTTVCVHLINGDDNITKSLWIVLKKQKLLKRFEERRVAEFVYTVQSRRVDR